MIDNKYYQTIIKCQDAASLCTAMVRNAASNIALEKVTEAHMSEILTKIEELRRSIDHAINDQIAMGSRHISTRL